MSELNEGDLILAVPSKGRLQENTHDFFARAGFDVTQQRGARDYLGRMQGIENVSVRYLSAGEIARELARGGVHLGVTGEDLVRETIPDADSVVLKLQPLGFGQASVSVAVPEAWIDVTTMADLEDVANRIRHRHGRILRVATKYVTLTRGYFAKAGLGEMRDYRIVESAGATEGAPAAGTADLIVDITTTGATLAANRLRVLKDGVILASDATLFLGWRAQWGGRERASLEALLIRIEAERRARRLREVRCIAPDDAVARRVAAAFNPGEGAVTASQSSGNIFYFHVEASAVFDVVDRLRGEGADHVTVRSLDYIFRSGSDLFARVKDHLL